MAVVAATVRQQGSGRRVAGHATRGDRWRLPVCAAGQFVGCRGRVDRCNRQAQPAGTRAARGVPQLLGGRSGAHQRALQLLALSLRRARRHAHVGVDGGAARGHRAQGHLPDRAGLQLRPGRAARGAAPAGAPATRRAHRRPGVAPGGAHQGFHALCRQDSRHRSAGRPDRQLGERSDPAREGCARRRFRGALLHLLRECAGCASGDRRGGCRQGGGGGRLAAKRRHARECGVLRDVSPPFPAPAGRLRSPAHVHADRGPGAGDRTRARGRSVGGGAPA